MQISITVLLSQRNKNNLSHFFLLQTFDGWLLWKFSHDNSLAYMCRCQADIHSEKKEEPKWLLRGTIFLSAEWTPLWHCFGSSFLSGAVFLKKKVGNRRHRFSPKHDYEGKNGSTLPKRSHFQKRLLWGTILAPLFFWVIADLSSKL